MTSDLISAADALERLQLRARSSLTRLVQSGAITPALKGSGIRGEQFFERSDVEALAVARSVALHPSGAVAASPRNGAGLHH